MVQRGSGLGFALKVASACGSRERPAGKNFSATKWAETGVLGLINDSHPAAAEFFDHAATPNGLSKERRVWHCAGKVLPRAKSTRHATPNPPTPNWFYGA
jgi:hypothetical protein